MSIGTMFFLGSLTFTLVGGYFAKNKKYFVAIILGFIAIVLSGGIS